MMMFRTWFQARWIPGLLLVVLLAGCGRSDRPALGEVSGVITLDGEPLGNAIIYFTPEGGGRPSTAISDASGRYELVYVGETKGAKVGSHTVRCSTAIETEDEQGNLRSGKELVPMKYRDESELKVEVAGGRQVLDLKLVSGGG